MYLIRNERQLRIYDFEGGRGFEPDFVLILRKDGDGWKYQIFIEPKGKHILQYDERKEKFLLLIDVEESRCRIIGLPMYNRKNGEQYKKFDEEFWEYVHEIHERHEKMTLIRAGLHFDFAERW